MHFTLTPKTASITPFSTLEMSFADTTNPNNNDNGPPASESMFEWQDVRVGASYLGERNVLASRSRRCHCSPRKQEIRQKYAAKYLRNSAVKKSNHTEAMEALRKEGQLLASLQHENIVTLSTQGHLSTGNRDSGRHYLLLTSLDETLQQRLQDWRFPDGWVEKPPQLERLRLVAIPVARLLSTCIPRI